MDKVSTVTKLLQVAEEGREIKACARGSVHTEIKTHTGVKNIKLNKVLVVPKLCSNIISVPRLVRQGNTVNFSPTGAKIIKGRVDIKGKLIAEAAFVDGTKFILTAKHIKPPLVSSNEMCLKSTLVDIMAQTTCACQRRIPRPFKMR